MSVSDLQAVFRQAGTAFPPEMAQAQTHELEKLALRGRRIKEQERAREREMMVSSSEKAGAHHHPEPPQTNGTPTTQRQTPSGKGYGKQAGGGLKHELLEARVYELEHQASRHKTSTAERKASRAKRQIQQQRREEVVASKIKTHISNLPALRAELSEMKPSSLRKRARSLTAAGLVSQRALEAADNAPDLKAAYIQLILKRSTDLIKAELEGVQQPLSPRLMAWMLHATRELEQVITPHSTHLVRSVSIYSVM